MRLLTTLIAVTCFSQAASAADLTSGSITNQTTATADVVFNQPVTLENTLTPVAGLKAGETSSFDNMVTIATGKLAIKETGVTARLALKLLEPDESEMIVYAEGHQGEEGYALFYSAVPDGADVNAWDTITVSDGNYMISPAGQRQLTYKVVGLGVGDVLPKAGKYTISATGAVYNP